MSPSNRHLIHPPHPPFKFRIGLTGHLEVENPDAVRCRLTEVMAEIRTWVCGVPATGNYADSEPELILISALARGVDCMGAEIALGLDYKLHAVLPFPVDEYRIDFKHAADRVLFELLLEEAHEHTLELDGKRGKQLDESYLAAGETILRCCDLLIAVWDESREVKIGGARDIVARAGQMGLRIVWIDATGLREPCWWRESRPVDFALLKETVVGSLLSPPGSGLQQYYAEKEHRWLWGWSYELAVAALACRWPRPRMRSRAYRNTSLENWKTQNTEFADEAAKHFQPYDQWADNLAVHYSSLARGVLTFILFFSALGLSLGLTLGEDSPEWARALSPALALLSVGLFWSARRRDFNRKWIEYRTLSEMLRNSALMSAIGGSLPLRSRFQGKEHFSSRWAEWYAAALVRSFGLVHAVFDKHYLDWYRRMLRDRVSAQASYHWKRSTEYHRVKRVLDTLAAVFFVGAAIAAVIELWSHSMKTSPQANFNPQSIAWVSAIVSAGLAAFSNFGGFDRLALVSKVVSENLKRIAAELEDLDHLSQDILYQRATAAVEIMMTEHEDWYFFYTLRDMEKPL